MTVNVTFNRKHLDDIYFITAFTILVAFIIKTGGGGSADNCIVQF